MELGLQIYKHVYPSSDSDHRLDGRGAALRFTLATYGYDRLVLGNISLIVQAFDYSNKTPHSPMLCIHKVGA